MSLAFLLYIAHCCGTIQCVLGLLTLGIFISVVGLSIQHASEYNPDEEKTKKFIKRLKKCVYVFLAVAVVAILSPSERTIYMMMGASYIQNSSITPKIEKIIEKKLDSYLLDDDREKK